jgi:4-hydroxy-tetrahydrodipicolinate synthase
MFTGSLVALITPMRQDGSLDEQAYARFIEWQIEQGTQGIVPVGTTGESPTLSHDEHRRAVAIAVEVSRKRVPVIAGAGSNSTEEAIGLAQHARDVGADGVMVVTPYYNKPSQEGLFRHYSAIADAAGIPLLIYNIPSRCVIDITVETMARLAAHPHIVGVKDATANLSRPLHTRRACGPGFVQLSGEDHTVVSFLAAGGDGCISVTANVAPKRCAEIHTAWRAGRIEQAIAMQDQLLALHDAMFCEPSPGPAKFAASLLGFCTPFLRLPLTPISEAAQDKVRAAMTEAGLI